MKTNRIVLFIPLLLFHLHSFSQQDIIVQPDAASRGQRLQVLFSGVNVNFQQASYIQLFFEQGSNVVIYPEVFHVQASDLAMGIYEIPVNANCGSYSLNSYYGLYLNLPNKFTVDCSAQIAGNVYFDSNGNGTKDFNENGVEGATITIQPAAGSEIIALTDVSGNYSALASLGAYSVNIRLPQYHNLSSATTTYNINLTSGNNVASGLDFGIAYDGAHNDLEISLASTNPIAGFSTTYWVACHNTGTTTQDAFISLSLDNNLTFNFASVPPLSSTGGTVAWNAITLQPGETINIAVDATVAVVFPNTQLTVSTQVITLDPDETPGNNTDTLTQFVRTSYDPNDKLVEPEGVAADKWTLKDEYLTYTIRFQNTGNYYAFNVRITDVLDENLDYSTLQIISSSHAMEYALESETLVFSFNNIMLPDSNMDLSGSNGYVQYRVRPKAGLADNTVIENTADIYFDFNPAVTTNTTINKLVDIIPVVTGITGSGISSEAVRIFPNPFEKGQSLAIEISRDIPISSVESIQIFTQDGRQVFQTNLVNKHFIRLPEIPGNGLLMIRVQCVGNVHYGKAVRF